MIKVRYCPGVARDFRLPAKACRYREPYHRFLRCIAFAIAVTIFAGTLRGEAPTEIVAFGSSVLLNRQNGADPTWVDYLATDLDVPLHNHAVGGAGVSGAFAQIDAYLKSNVPSGGTLFVLWPGPRPYLQESIPTPADWDYVTLEEKVGEMVQRLVDAGAGKLFIPELHWGFAPRSEDIHPGQRSVWIDVMTDYNKRQASRLDDIAAAENVEFSRPGWYELHQVASDTPQVLGFADGTTPGQNSGFPELHVFWDDVHQSTAFHRLLADDAYLTIVGELPRTSISLTAVGGAFSEDFDAALDIDDRSIGQKLPGGWTTTGPQRLIPETRVSRQFNRGRFGRALGNGEVFNAGVRDEEDRALATSLSRSDLSSDINLGVEMAGGNPRALRLAFDLEAWGVERAIKEPGEVAFDLKVDGLSGKTPIGSLLTATISKDVAPPPSGESVNGNQSAYRTHFDSGVIDTRDVEIDELQIHWSTISGVGSEGWVFGLDNFILRTALDGDANVDGRVDFGDFLVLSSGFGNPGTWKDGDFDQDGEVQFPDFLLLAGNFGLGNGPNGAVASVPEPGGLSLGILASILLSVRRHRHSSTPIPDQET